MNAGRYSITTGTAQTTSLVRKSISNGGRGARYYFNWPTDANGNFEDMADVIPSGAQRETPPVC